jgi:outer membrane protein TolC
MASADRVESEVRSARILLVQALDSLRRMQDELLPSLAETADLAAKAYENGDISYLELQQARQPFLDAQLSAQNAVARVRQARAELARAIGRPL